MATIQPTLASLTDAFRSMLVIRGFEERALALREANEIAGSIHLCTGQEAIPVGALAALAPTDRVVATYRGHGWAIACGVPPADLMAEICQRATGINGGRGGSAHLMAPEHGLLGENSIVGAGVPIAAGAALAARSTGSDRVVVVSVGDGATSQGAFHEGLVFAAFRRLPLIVVCENNGWSEMTPIDSIVLEERLALRAEGYGIPGVTIDGNDPLAVQETVADAVVRARGGEGPTFIEARCHRLGAHYNGDIEHYRPEADRAAARAADPLGALRTRLLATGVDEAELAALESEVGAELDAACVGGGGCSPARTRRTRVRTCSTGRGRLPPDRRARVGAGPDVRRRGHRGPAARTRLATRRDRLRRGRGGVRRHLRRDTTTAGGVRR